MRKFFAGLMMMLCVSMTLSAANPKDTVRVDNRHISRVVEDKTTNSKGDKVSKYYVVYKDELISTSKNVYEKYNLCRKYHAKLALAMVINKKNKRIILD